jgi:GR25 family glycosyltransferase involved in LPS biosynthesis
MEHINIILINLKERKDRLIRCLDLFNYYFDNNFSIHIIEAFLNKENGHKGCAFSHFLAMEYAIQKGFDKVIIIEDDVFFHYPLIELKLLLLKLKEIEWDLIAMGSNFDIDSKINDFFLKPSRIWQSTMQIINKPYYKKYTNFLFWSYMKQKNTYEGLNDHLDSWVFDQAWNRYLLETDKIYCPHNRFAYQIANMSNTTNVMMDGIRDF